MPYCYSNFIRMISNFNTNTNNNDEWLTPRWLLELLGEFDLDPCSPHPDR